MIRKISVGLKELTAGRVRAERCQNFRREESAAAVARVDDNFHARERFIGAEFVRDDFAQVSRVTLNQVEIFHAVERSLNRAERRGSLQDCFDVRGLKPAVACEKFHAVAIEGQMACREHNRAVGGSVVENRRHKHCRRRRQAAVDDRHTVSDQSFAGGSLNLRRTDSRIVADCNFQRGRCLAEFVSQKFHESACNAIDSLRRECDRFARHAVHRHAAHVAAVVELEQFFFRHHKKSPRADYNNFTCTRQAAVVEGRNAFLSKVSATNI